MATDESFKFYKILRDGDVKVIFDNKTKTTWVDTLVNENSIYNYELMVLAETGMAAIDTILVKTPQWGNPDNLTANGLSETDVLLMWDDNSDSEGNFLVYLYNETNMTFIDSINVAADVTELQINGLDSLDTYRFNVKAQSVWEEDTELSADEYFIMANFVFAPPSGLQLSMNDDYSINVTWIDHSTLETDFCIERKINDGYFVEIGDVSLNIENFCDMDTLYWAPGDSLTYRVRAVKDYNGLEYTDYCSQRMIIVIDLSIHYVTIELQVDYYYMQASWNIYNYDNSTYYYATDQQFSQYYEELEVDIELTTGHYAVECYDSYGNGGIEGSVTYMGEVLVDWEDYMYGNTGVFDFEIED